MKRILLSLTLIVLLAGAVFARPAAAGDISLCAFSGGAIIANGSDQEIGTFNVSPGTNPDAVTVTLTASVLGGSLVRVNLIGPTSAVGAGDYHSTSTSATFSSDASVKATVGGDGNGEISLVGTIVWTITSSGGGCIAPGNGGGGVSA